MSNDREIVRNFIAAILLQAVKDWVAPPINQLKDEVPVSKDEIREFLTDKKWGATLCRAIDLTPETILHKFENNDFCADLLKE